MRFTCIIVSCILLIWCGITPVNSKCSVQFEKVGCYKDKHGSKRPLPNLIMTDRDPSSKVYSSIRLKDNWKKWPEYIKGLACRCAQKTKVKGWKMFGLQYFGECWSSPSTQTYALDGPAKKENCIADDFKKPCLSSSPVCVGKQYTNYIYSLVQTITPTNPTKPPTVVPVTTECQKYIIDLTMPGITLTKDMNNPVTMDFMKMKGEVTKTILQVYADYASYTSFTILYIRDDKRSVVVHLLLEFTKKGKHLITLIEKLGKNRITKAECFKPKPYCQGTCINTCAPTCSMECCYPYVYPLYCPQICQSACTAVCPSQCCPQTQFI